MLLGTKKILQYGNTMVFQTYTGEYYTIIIMVNI